MTLCRICQEENSNQIFSVKEMMLGLRESFSYFECLNCGCLQIVEIPQNISQYYPNNYYSLDNSPEIHFTGLLKRVLKAKRDAFLISGYGILGLMIQKIYPNQSIELINFREAKLKKSDKILDVGCGAGIIPYVFYNAGFKNIIGIDPFINSDINYANGLSIKKKDFLNLTEDNYSVIMYNHSFEHLTNPKEHLEKAHNILAPNGKIIIRIPTVSSFAWKKYGVNWVQLDAPRHIFLYSINSLKILADNTGFQFDNITYESSSFQFVGSEQYLKDIPLNHINSYFKGNKNLFSSKEIKNYIDEAVSLNKHAEGDSIAVVFKKTTK